MNKLFTIKGLVELSDDKCVEVVAYFAPDKKRAKQWRKKFIKGGFSPMVQGEIEEIDPTDWTVAITNPNYPDALPLVIAKGSRFIAEMEHFAETLKQTLPPYYQITVQKFDETALFAQYTKSINTEMTTLEA